MKAFMIRSILSLVVLVLFSAYFSATETAFSSLNKTRLKTLAEKGNRKAKLALSLCERYDKLLSTILVGNNIVNIAMASVGTVLFVRIMGNVGATVSTAVITVTVLFFGEITPKSIAKDCPETFAMFSAPFIRLLTVLLTPVNAVFSLWKKLVAGVLKVERGSKMSQEELLMLVDEVQEEGSIDKEEGSLLRNAIEFSDLRAEDILTHRVDIDAIDVGSSKQEIAAVFDASRFSRLPVYEDTIDHIIGILHHKDFYSGAGVTDKSVRDLMTAPIFVLKNEHIDDLLKLLQANKAQVAVVLDEFGGTLGIVTIEDILEELVGEIWDEHDEVTENFKPAGENRYMVDGLSGIDDFAAFFGAEPHSESISVGGWVMEQLGKIPEVGDSFTDAGLFVTVASLDGQRVESICVEKRSSANACPAAEAEESGNG